MPPDALVADSISGTSMGTSWSVKLDGRQVDLDRLRTRIHQALTELEAQMSTWDPGSGISRLNRAAPGWYQVAPAFYQVLSEALELARLTQGAYDPTIGGLVSIWGFGPQGPVTIPPAPAAIQAALASCGWQRTALEPKHRAVWQPGGVQFDLSSIAKGYGVDEIMRTVQHAGVAHALVELGGELKAAGNHPAGQPWCVEIDSPDTSSHQAAYANNRPWDSSMAAAPNPAQSRIPVLLRNSAIATSGDYRRHFTHEGRRYAHTLNPKTGTPLDNQLASVTVLHPQCLLADGWATALLTQGAEQGLALARQHRIAALFITRDEADLAAQWTGEFAELAGVSNM